MQRLSLFLSLMLFSSISSAQGNCSWTGTWSSTKGDLRLIQEGRTVTGDYANNGTLQGKTDAECRLTGTFDDFRFGKSGEIDFVLSGDRFRGTWSRDQVKWQSLWTGNRRTGESPTLINGDMAEQACVWTGTWSSNLGNLLLTQTGARVSGTHKRIGDIDGSADGCRLTAKIAGEREEQSLDIAITKTGPRFAGTWTSRDPEKGGARVWTGTLHSAKPPTQTMTVAAIAPTTLPQSSDPQSSDPQPEAAEVEESLVKKARWSVDLGAICASTLDGGSADIYGIAWVKARIVNKSTGDEVTLRPVGGFRNVTGDQERVWQIYDSKALELEERSCETRHFQLYKRLSYTVDATEFGYTDMEELMADDRNRIRVMVKLAIQELGSDRELGSKAVSTPMRYANFKSRERDLRGIVRFNGDGILSGFDSGENHVRVLYSIEYLEGG